MTTKKLYITSTTDDGYIRNKCIRYSCAFRSLYKQIELSADPDFIKAFKQRFLLNATEYNTLNGDVVSFVKREETRKKRITKRIEELQADIDHVSDIHRKWKLYNRICSLKKSIGNGVVFGGRKTLQELTKECNRETKNVDKIESLRHEYHEKRVRPFVVMGEANQKANRFFDFSKVGDKVIIYKPQKGVKIEIHFACSSKRLMKDLLKLAELADKKEIPITVSLNNDFITLAYDEERLNGYHLDESSRRREVKELKAQGLPKVVETEKIREIYRKYYDEQRERKERYKIKNRCLSIDMNPTNIGWSVNQLMRDNSVKVIACGVMDLGKLCVNLGRSSDDKMTVHQRNKRKYELTMIVKMLFTLALHYRCSKFVMEDLEFSTDSDQGREANRKNRNLWCRELITNCITRRCNETGIELVKVNACYTSFIGNVKYPYSDACNASIEIGRRGLTRYIKGEFYPCITDRDIDTLVSKFGRDVRYYTSGSWVGIFKVLKDDFPDGREFSHRLRPTLDNCVAVYSMFSLNSYKSRVNSFNFKIL